MITPVYVFSQFPESRNGIESQDFQFTFVRNQQGCYYPEKCCFSCSVGTNETEYLTLRHLKGDILQGLCIPEFLAYARCLDYFLHPVFFQNIASPGMPDFMDPSLMTSIV